MRQTIHNSKMNGEQLISLTRDWISNFRCDVSKIQTFCSYFAEDLVFQIRPGQASLNRNLEQTKDYFLRNIFEDFEKMELFPYDFTCSPEEKRVMCRMKSKGKKD